MSEWMRAKCDSGACVEVKKSTVFSEMRMIRSSQRAGNIITVTEDEWQTFVAAVKAGEFDE